MSQTQTTNSDTSDTHPAVSRFIDEYDADRYEETAAAGENDGMGYINPELTVTLFGENVRIHPDATEAPYGIDLDTLQPADGYDTVEIDDGMNADTSTGYELTRGSVSHVVDKAYVDLVADVFDADTETVLNNASVKTEWDNFPVLFDHPDGDDVRMMVSPYITN